MDNVARPATPAHFWVVAVLATLWNLIGPTDYLMTRSRNDEWINMMMPGVDPQAVYSWVEAMPIWSQIGWGLGVWGGLAGALLLLARSRHAVLAFAASLVGVLLSLGWQLLAGVEMPAGTDQGAASKVMPIVIIVIAVALLYYARRMQLRGVLR